MIARTVYYIRSESLGLFMGEFMGLGFFENSKKDGTLSEKEEPIQFTSEKEAQAYLDGWIGGKADCFVEEGIG